MERRGGRCGGTSAAIVRQLATSAINQTPHACRAAQRHMNGAMNGHGERSWAEQFLPAPLRLQDSARAREIEARLSGLVLDGATLLRVAQVFEDEMERGLRQQPSSLQMENTYLPDLSDGTEQGLFLALDLGGTNFRVLLLELVASKPVREDVKQYHIQDELRLGTGEALFDFLASCVLDFLREKGYEDMQLSLGFTFSFPMRQHSIASGELITWTKSFKCSGMGGVDVAALLQRALDARGLRVTVRALLNDTTGTLVAGAYGHADVGIGVILGTGSNGCYMERASRVAHWEARPAGVREVCVDVEWGAFGDNGCLHFIRTPLDRQVDAHSLLAGSFTFEKYISGKYLGEVCARALAALALAGLFPAAPPPHVLLTAHLSLFEQEQCAGEMSRTLATLREVCAGASFTEEDARVAQHVAHVVSNRAAQLVSVCISSLVRRRERPRVTVAVDGSLYKHHPRLAPLLHTYTGLLAPHHQFTMVGVEDGSGKGAALTAAIAERIARRAA